MCMKKWITCKIINIEFCNAYKTQEIESFVIKLKNLRHQQNRNETPLFLEKE